MKIPRGRNQAGSIEYLTLTYAELDAEVEAWAAHLRRRGVAPGDRVVVMVKQGLPLIAAAFALFKCGAVPIVIDPGMGLKTFLSCIESSRPRVLLGIPLARLISHVFRPAFRTVKLRVAASGNPLARRKPPAIRASSQPAAETSAPIFRDASDLAAILFTSGSTGSPKGVCYEHGMFEAQVRLIQATYHIQPGEIDLPLLPIFALFNPALGMTTIVPEIDPSHPAEMDPAKIVQAIQQERVTNSFGSPTLWNKIAQHCIQHGETLPSLKRVLCAGAPVPASLWERAARFLPNGELHSPYGATEALPVSSVSAVEMAELRKKEPVPLATRETSIAPTTGSGTFDRDDLSSPVSYPGGTCVGRPVAGMAVKIIAFEEGTVASLEEIREVPLGEIGEIIVSGPVVTNYYDALPVATAAAKIQLPNTKRQKINVSVEEDTRGTWHLDSGAATAAPGVAVWHRMGDCGYFDAEGRLWFCGRKVERVETPDGLLFTEACEQVFRSEPGVARCALIGLGKPPSQIPAIVIEPESGSLSPQQTNALAVRLRSLASTHAATRSITRFYFHRSFPVDVRHNAKIHRLTLAKWAATQTPIEIP